MKVKNSHVIISVSTIIVLVVVCIIYFHNILYCSSFNKGYYEWFPYNEGDSLIYINKNQTRIYTIKELRFQHINSVHRNCKCTGCGDFVTFRLTSNPDTINFDATNIFYVSPGETPSVQTQSNEGDSTDKWIMKHIELDSMQCETFKKGKYIKAGILKLERFRGIVEIYRNNEIWRLIGTKKSKKEKVLETIDN